MGRKLKMEAAKLSDKMKKSLINGGYTKDDVELISGFGRRIQDLRISKRMTQRELAEKMNIVTASIGKYEHMTDAFPSIDVLLRLSRFFNVSLDYMLKGVDSNLVVGNNVNGGVTSNSFVQANHGKIVVNDVEVSQEAGELLKLYSALNGSDKLKVLKYVVEMSEKAE